MPPTLPRCYSPDLITLSRSHSPYPTSPRPASPSPFRIPNDLLALSFVPPSKPSSHPLVLVNLSPETGLLHPLASVVGTDLPTPLISSAAEEDEKILAPLARKAGSGGGVGDVKAVRVQPFIQQMRVGGLFVREEDAAKLGLKRVGEAETIYGVCPRYTPVTAIIFNHHRLIQNVFALPRAFENTKYHDGVCGVDTLLDLGFSVMVDRGMVYLTDPERSQYGRA